MSVRRVVLTAMPFGYGPAAKALAIAAELQRFGTTPAFVGSGIACELAARSPELFSDVVNAARAPRRASALIKSSARVVSVMDRDSATLARRLGRPFDVVDSLLWMRDEVPRPLRAASRYWAQRLDGMRWRRWRSGPRPIPVGPVIDPSRRHDSRRASLPGKLVVNLGGCESPDGAMEAPAYSQFVMEGLRESELFSSHAGETVVMAGSRCITRLARRFRTRDVRFVSLPHREALAEFASAAFVWTSPGLTASLECFQQGVPTFFLPPENYSQWCILRAFRKRGLAPSSFHWEDVLPGPRLRDRLPEAQRTPVVRRAIRELSAGDRAAEAFRRRLQESPDVSLPRLARLQGAYLRGLGPNGATVIARSLAGEGALTKAPG